MRKWIIIIAAAFVTAWFVMDTVREFIGNETIQYFSSQPRRLLYVAGIAVASGFMALAFDRLSREAQRRVRLFACGAAASVLTTFVGCMVFCLASLPTLIMESVSSAWVVLAVLLFSAIAAYLWFEFYRAWKTRASQ